MEGRCRWIGPGELTLTSDNGKVAGSELALQVADELPNTTCRGVKGVQGHGGDHAGDN